MLRDLLVAAYLVQADWGRDPAQASAKLDRLVGHAAGAVSPVADDAEFVRRVTIDIIGRIPTAEEAVSFLDSNPADKRRKWIDDLLARTAYGAHFATIWAELIAPPDTSSAKRGQDPFTPWLADQFNRNRPWNEIVTALVTAEGKVRENPQSGFVLANCLNQDPQPDLLTDSMARLFWGVQLRCAQCHDHPFAQWTMEDFWGTAAFFSRLRRGYTQGKNPAGATLTENPPDEPISMANWKSLVPAGSRGAAIVVPKSVRQGAGKAVRARFLCGEGPDWSDDGPFRERFARWATGPGHPFFAKNAANRLWAHFFGRGLAHPVDELAPGALGSHPEVLNLLAQEFVDAGQDLKHLIRVIANSRSYQRSSAPREGSGSELLGRTTVKVLRPEVLYDSLSVALLQPTRKPGSKGPFVVDRISGIPGVSRDEFVRFFAMQNDRGGSSVNPGIPQFLRLMNGPLLNSEGPGLGQFAGRSVESAYLAAYSRRPRPDEARKMEEYLACAPDPKRGMAGITWALFCSSEFVLNH